MYIVRVRGRMVSIELASLQCAFQSWGRVFLSLRLLTGQNPPALAPSCTLQDLTFYNFAYALRAPCFSRSKFPFEFLRLYVQATRRRRTVQDRTAETAEPKWNIQNRTGRQDRPNRTGIPGRQNRTGRTRLSGQYCQKGTVRTPLPGQDLPERAARTGRLRDDSQGYRKERTA